ncbi:MAG: hypothetical protein JOY80_07100 [Candidatus Dormibacteraeota bacterium]|nr:hypothetical protein [Candidatus Dormibacteraeota bacterium]
MRNGQSSLITLCALMCASLLAAACGSTSAAQGGSSSGSGGGNGSSGSGGSSGGSAAGGSGGSVQKVSMQLTGAVSGTLTYTSTNQYATCADDVAAGTPAVGGTEEGVPGPDNAMTFQGQPFTFLIAPGHYTGAGTYDQSNFNGNNNQAVSIGSANYHANQPGANSMMTVNADGSGSCMFTNWADPASGATESGSFTWTCSGH